MAVKLKQKEETMKISKMLMAVMATLVIAVGSAFYVNASFVDSAACGTGDVASKCGKCGDGYCNPRCGENATNCPRDCGGVPSAK